MSMALGALQRGVFGVCGTGVEEEKAKMGGMKSMNRHEEK